MKWFHLAHQAHVIKVKSKGTRYEKRKEKHHDKAPLPHLKYFIDLETHKESPKGIQFIYKYMCMQT